MHKRLNSNIWKLFLHLLTDRRNYTPILSVYFLTLPNTAAHQIGIYLGIGWIMGTLFEIPSGYISDKIGHKKALILDKIFMLLSTLFFAFGNSFPYFILGSIFVSLSISLSSGTKQAFLHDTLIGMKREKDFSNIFGKIEAKVSLVSAIMILLLPLLSKVSLVMPIKAYLIFDVLGLIISFTLIDPKIKHKISERRINLSSQIKEFRGTGFYITSLFFGLIAGFIMAVGAFNIPYATSLGLPVIYAGAIMALSRAIWFGVGHNLKRIKKIGIKNLIIFEIIFFPITFLISSRLKNPYVFVGIMALGAGYFWARRAIIEEYYLKHFSFNKKYKATMLSIKSLIEKLLQSFFVFLIGIFMGISYKTGYLFSGTILFVLLLIVFFFMKRYIKN